MPLCEKCFAALGAHGKECPFCEHPHIQRLTSRIAELETELLDRAKEHHAMADEYKQRSVQFRRAFGDEEASFRIQRQRVASEVADKQFVDLKSHIAELEAENQEKERELEEEGERNGRKGRRIAEQMVEIDELEAALRPAKGLPMWKTIVRRVSDYTCSRFKAGYFKSDGVETYHEAVASEMSITLGHAGKLCIALGRDPVTGMKVE